MTNPEDSFQSRVARCISDQVDEVLSWLNLFQPGGSALTPEALKYLLEAQQAEISIKEVIANIKKAIAESQKLEGSLETPEIWVRGAVLFFKRGLVDDAISLLHQALPLYARAGERVHPATRQKVGPHRAGIVRWLLLLMYLAKNNRAQALTFCAAARNDLVICRNATLQDKKSEVYDPANRRFQWYDQRLQDLDIEEALIPEHVIGWISMYAVIDPARATLLSQGFVMDPSPGTVTLLNNILEHIRTGKPKDAVMAEIELLVQLARGEAYSVAQTYLLAHAGMAYFLSDEIHKGLECLRNARTLSLRGSTAEAVLTWLIGLFEWQVPELRVSAQIDGEKAILLMNDLSIKADRQDRQDAQLWFAARRVAMREGLKRLSKCA